MLRIIRRQIRRLAGILLLAPAAVSDLTLDILLRGFPRAAVWQELLQVLLMVIFTTLWMMMIGSVALLIRKGPATLTAEILLSVRQLYSNQQDDHNGQKTVFETHVVLENNVISAVIGMCQAIVTLTTASMIITRCLLDMFLWNPILAFALLITCEVLLVVVSG